FEDDGLSHRSEARRDLGHQSGARRWYGRFRSKLVGLPSFRSSCVNLSPLREAGAAGSAGRRCAGIAAHDERRSTQARRDEDSVDREESAWGEVPALDGAARVRLREELDRWRRGPVADAMRQKPLRRARFATWSDIEVPDLATRLDAAIDDQKD